MWASVKPPLSKETLTVLKHFHFDAPTPVQSAVIPLMLKKKEVVAEAVTGSGKTLAFVIPVIENLISQDLQHNGVFCVVISPTRDLAQQIHSVFKSFFKTVRSASSVLLVGGCKTDVSIGNYNRINGMKVVVATPGRFIELLEMKQFELKNDIKHIEILIFDEADRLLELGFKNRLNRILTAIPKQRQTCLFSATQTDAVDDLVRAGIRQPQYVKVQQKSSLDQKTPLLLNNNYLQCEPCEKMAYIFGFLKEHSNEKIMLFFSTIRAVFYFGHIVKELLPECHVILMHGKMRKKRYRNLENFHNSKKAVLITTDVMSRGIDVADVDWVVHGDAPTNSNCYIHRSGRTARSGTIGNSLIVLLPNEIKYIEFLEVSMKVPVKPLEHRPLLFENLSEKIRNMARGDREVLEGGTRAFVSFIQSYTKHDCFYIFNTAELDICGLAESFGLLRLPQMPELKGHDTSKFHREATQLSSIKFLDKNREKQRLERIALLAERKIAEANEKKKRKKKSKVIRSKFKQKFTNDEINEILTDAAMVKKLKRKKITEQNFDEAMGISSRPKKVKLK